MLELSPDLESGGQSYDGDPQHFFSFSSFPFPSPNSLFIKNIWEEARDYPLPSHCWLHYSVGHLCRRDALAAQEFVL